MLFLKLDCGRDVSLDALEYSRTYAGLLEGRPNADLNRRIVESVVGKWKSSPGQRGIYLIPPAVNHDDPEHPHLPPVILQAQLTCLEPIDPDFMASSLRVIWFAEECHTESMADIVFRAVRTLPWEELAADFDW